ncbi:MAG TPA: hypothetical protein VF683_06375, partial [Chthoniobacterales bacterium]
LFLGAAALPTALLFLLLWRLGVFERFWFWTVTYARDYAQLVPLRQAGRIFSGSISGVLAPSWPIWAFAAGGLVACVASKRERQLALLLVGFLSSAAVAISLGFYFRPHYFVLALPAVSLCVGAAIHCAETGRATLLKLAAFVLLAGSLAFAIVSDGSFFFRLDPISACRSAYPGNPFPETIAVAEFLRTRTSPDDSIAVLGSEPQIPFYAQRRSATGYVYTYALMEAQPHARAMQAEMIREIEAAQPRYLVFVGVPASWSVQARSPRLIFEWMNRYTAAGFRVSELVDVVPGLETKSYLPAPPGIVPNSRDFIVIYERNSAPAD